MLLKGKKVIILIEEMFNVFEFWYPYYRLKEEGAEVTVVGSGVLKFIPVNRAHKPKPMPVPTR